MSMDEPIYLALGSNLGDRQGNLWLARKALSPEVLILRTSPIYLTPPWGYADQPDFFNQVIEVRTHLAPLPLLDFLKAIEAEMGRMENFRNGPRLIDLDILFYGRRVVESESLQIPHPRLVERAFVLVPLCDLAPDLIHPVLNVTVASLLSKVGEEGIRRL